MEETKPPSTTNHNLFYENLPVRMVQRENGELWFVARDVCDVLDLENVTWALNGLDEDELTLEKLKSGGQAREMKLVSESGLYTLIFRSNKPEAKPFRRWVTKEVLPAIRKTGSYTVRAELIPENVVERVSGLENEVRSLRLGFDGYGTIWSFIHYCCEPGSQRDITIKDDAYGAYDAYCRAVKVKPECRSHFCGKIYRTVNGSYSTTVNINGVRCPAIKGFRLLPGYQLIIEDLGRNKEERDLQELKRRRLVYGGVGEESEDSEQTTGDEAAS